MTVAPVVVTPADAEWHHEYSWQLEAMPGAVFHALTAPDALRRWFAEQVDIGSAAGAPFRFWGRHSLETPTAADATQRLIAWEPDRVLAFTWSLHGVPTEVHLTLGPGKRTARRHCYCDMWCRARSVCPGNASYSTITGASSWATSWRS